jgi:hypothetical protein
LADLLCDDCLHGGYGKRKGSPPLLPGGCQHPRTISRCIEFDIRFRYSNRSEFDLLLSNLYGADRRYANVRVPVLVQFLSKEKRLVALPLHSCLGLRLSQRVWREVLVTCVDQDKDHMRRAEVVLADVLRRRSKKTFRDGRVPFPRYLWLGRLAGHGARTSSGIVYRNKGVKRKYSVLGSVE